MKNTSPPPTPSLLLAAVTVLAAAAIAASDQYSKVGICYGRGPNNLPPLPSTIAVLKSNAISRVRIFRPDPDVLDAFASSGISLMIGVPDADLPSLSSAAAASDWLKDNIFRHLPADQLLYLAVGEGGRRAPSTVLLAMISLHQALKAMGLDEKIKVSSSPVPASDLAASHPPSSGVFKPEILDDTKALLSFLNDTGAPFMARVYPFFTCANADAGHSRFDPPLGYAIFSSDVEPVRDVGGLTYTCLYDATIDAFVSAMEKLGFHGIPVVVAETRWPTAAGERGGRRSEEEELVGPMTAMAYNNQVVRRTASGVGTPKRPGVPVEVFLFDMYDEEVVDAPPVARHFGIFNRDGSKAYNLDFAS